VKLKGWEIKQLIVNFPRIVFQPELLIAKGVTLIKKYLLSISLGAKHMPGTGKTASYKSGKP
jgi:hypothetical protein